MQVRNSLIVLAAHHKLSCICLQFPVPFARVGKYHSENHLMVVSSFGRFIPWKKLKNFRPSRRLNLHPSLVPKYRGASPIQYAIADDCKETGVSIIEVERVGLGYDKGNIWAQKVVVSFLV